MQPLTAKRADGNTRRQTRGIVLCREVEMCIDEELIARLVEYMKLNLIDELEETENSQPAT